MIKKLLILFSLLLIFSVNIVKCQFIQDTSYFVKYENNRNILKTNPFTMLIGSIPFSSEFRLVYETVVSRRNSIQFGGSLLGKGMLLTLIESAANPPVTFKAKGFRFQIELKHYLLQKDVIEKAPKGLYLSIAYSFSRLKITDKKSTLQDDYLSMTNTNYCLKTGYQIIKKNLAFDAFIGIGYKDNYWFENNKNIITKIKSKEYELIKEPFKILLGFNAGWAF